MHSLGGCVVFGIYHVDAPDGFGGRPGGGGIGPQGGEVVNALDGGGCLGDEFVAHLYALLKVVVTHEEVCTCKEGPCGIGGYVGGVAAGSALVHAFDGLLEVLDDGVVHFTDSGTLGLGVVHAYTERDAGVVAAADVRHCKERNHIEVCQCAEEVVLAEQLVGLPGVVAGFRIETVDVGVGGIDDLVAHPPGVGLVLSVSYVLIAVRGSEGVFRVTGNRDVVAAGFGQLEVVAQIYVAGFSGALALVGQVVLEQGVDAVGGIDCGLGVLLECG